MVTRNESKATLSVKDLADMLGIAENSAYEYLYQGLIPARRLGKRWIISREQILDWLNNAPAVVVTQR